MEFWDLTVVADAALNAIKTLTQWIAYLLYVNNTDNEVLT